MWCSIHGDDGTESASDLDGQETPLDRNDSETKIILAGNNYILSGGSDYDMLAGLPKYAEAGGELETIRSYIEKNLENGILTGYAGTEGRISYSGSVYQPKDYTVSVLQIVDEAGNPYADREISYRVDGGEGIMGKTDSDGYLKITLSDGGHGIRVSDAQAEVYVDNYAGIGLVTDAIRPVLKLTAPAPGSEIPVKEQGTQIRNRRRIRNQSRSRTQNRSRNQIRSRNRFIRQKMKKPPEMKQLFPAPVTAPCRRSTQQWLWRQWQCWY